MDSTISAQTPVSYQSQAVIPALTEASCLVSEMEAA